MNQIEKRKLKYYLSCKYSVNYIALQMRFSIGKTYREIYKLTGKGIKELYNNSSSKLVIYGKKPNIKYVHGKLSSQEKNLINVYSLQGKDIHFIARKLNRTINSIKYHISCLKNNKLSTKEVTDNSITNKSLDELIDYYKSLGYKVKIQIEI